MTVNVDLEVVTVVCGCTILYDCDCECLPLTSGCRLSKVPTTVYSEHMTVKLQGFLHLKVRTILNDRVSGLWHEKSLFFVA